MAKNVIQSCEFRKLLIFQDKILKKLKFEHKKRAFQKNETALIDYKIEIYFLLNS